MFDHILFPTDGSDESVRAVGHVVDIADEFDATVHVLFVANTNRDSVTVLGTEVVDALVQEGTKMVERVASTVRERGVDCETEVVQGSPGATISDFAEAHGMDLVAMATHGRTGLTRYLLGSVTETVVRTAEVPVLTLRLTEDARASFPYENVVVATDGSDAAAAATDRAVDLASALDATLHAVSVVDDAALGFDVRSVSTGEEMADAANDAVATVAENATEAGVEHVESVRHGAVHDELLAYADDEDADVIVMGTTGRGGTERVLLGSTAERVVRASPVPVITVRR